MESNVRTRQGRAGLASSPYMFLALALGTTWVCWIPAALASGETVIRVLHYLGGAMPALVAIYWVFSKYDRVEQWTFWMRIVEFRRIGTVWYALLFGLAPMLTLVAAASSLALGESMGTATISGFGSTVPLVVALFFFGPLPEEIAWRGVAQDGLNERMSPLVGGLMLGLFWIVWHLPLFGMDGSYQQGLGIGTLQFWLFSTSLIPQAVIMALIFTVCGRSTLSAILFHWSVNLTGELWDLSLTGELISAVGWWLVAGAMALWWLHRSRMASPVAAALG